MLTAEQWLHAFGLAVEQATEHIKRFHIIKIQRSVEVGTPLTDFIRPKQRIQEHPMSLESKIEALTAAVEALTAQLKLAGTGSTAAVGKDKEVAAPAPAPAPKPAKPAKPAEPEVSIEDMKAKVTEVKDTFGVAEAKAIIKNVGKAEKMGDITDPALVKAVFDAAVAKLAEEADDGV